MKKRFPCGHLGRGQFCHRCRQADNLEADVLTKNNRAARRGSPSVLVEVARLRALPGAPPPAPPQPSVEVRHQPEGKARFESLGEVEAKYGALLER